MRPMQKTRVAAALAAAVMLAAAPAAVRAHAPQAPPASAAPQAEGALDVTVTYKGKGEVSAKHEVTVFVFADANITPESEPIGVGVVEENGGHVVINGLPAKVYLAVVYDDQGTYERDSVPPPGTPVSIYGMATSGAAEAVKTGPGAKVSVTFDDSQRM